MTAQPPRRQVERHTEQQGPNWGQPQHPPIDRPFDARHSRLRQPQPHQWPRSRPGSNPRQRRPKERMHHRIDQRTPKERIEQFSAQQARSRGHARAFHRDRRQQRRSLPRPQPSIHRLNRSPVIHTDLITQISSHRSHHADLSGSRRSKTRQSLSQGHPRSSLSHQIGMYRWRDKRSHTGTHPPALYHHRHSKARGHCP